MTWPSGDRIRAVMNARQRGNGEVTPARAALTPLHRAVTDVSADLCLDGSELIYVFLFVRDPVDALSFYQGELGLRDLEGGRCSRESSGDEYGVVKYDTGGVILTTHHIVGTRTVTEVEEHQCPPRELDDNAMASVAPAFHVKNIDEVVGALSRNSSRFNYRLSRSEIGSIASFEDPSGHLFFLYEPSDNALRSPSGAKIREILTVPL
jgi:catechol 2,3-dioxygenase-like lactoylglutathione lyase family enzyme